MAVTGTTATGTTTAALEVPALPTRRDEAWRYAPHRDLERLQFGPPGAAADVPAEALASVPAEAPLVVMVNGVFDEIRSRPGAGVVGLTIAHESTLDPQLLAPHHDLDAAPPRDAYAAMNAELAADPVVVAVAAGVTVDHPVHVVHVTVPAPGGPDAFCSRMRIDLGEASSATVIERHVGSGDGAGGANPRTTVVLAPDATLEQVVVQDLPDQQVLLWRTDVHQAERSRFLARSFNLGARYGRIELRVDLAGAGADADLAGLYFGTGERVLDQQLTVVHRVADCSSSQSYRGVLDDASTGVFNGGIDVRPGADGTDARQSNDNLLLSRRAEVDTQPRLEILADDVACQHGATVGQLDASAVFYLRTRGLSADEAGRVLVRAFADQVVERVSDADVRNLLLARLGHDHD